MNDKALREFAGVREYRSDRPRDPRCAHLNAISMQIEHAAGMKWSDPNTLVEMALSGKLLSLPCLPDVVSAISGEPAVILRTNEVQIALTPEELDRLALRSLSPEQFTAVCDAVGAFYEIKPYWYDPDTGIAVDPIGERYISEEDEVGLKPA